MVKKRFILLAILVILGFAGFGVIHMYKMSLIGTVYHYKEGEETLKNPYIGYAPSATSTSLCEKSTLVYVNIYWSVLEPIEGVFDWNRIESENNLERWRKEGKNLVLRFVCDNPGDEEHMDIPSWLYAKTGDGKYYDIDYGKGYCPDYSNSVFIEEHKKAIQEIADHFRNDDFLKYVELGSLGHWGEWHTYYKADIPHMPLAEVRAKYVSHYAESFDYCKILMRRPFAELPKGAGVFNDMTGISHDTSIWLSWIEKGGDFSETGEENALAAVPEIWNYAPVGGEFASSVPISTMLGEDYEQTIDLLKKSHMSFVGPMVPYMKREDLEFYGTADKAAKYIGYRYRVDNIDIVKPLGNKNALITVDMVNDGVAPTYFDFTPCLYLLVPDGKEEKVMGIGNDGYGAAGTDAEGMLRFVMDIDLKELTQDKDIKTVVEIPRELLKIDGTKLYVGIENPKTDEPFVSLDMKSERNGKLSLLWENK